MVDVMRLRRRARDILGGPLAYSRGRSLLDNRTEFARAVTLVRAFYVFSFYVITTEIAAGWSKWLEDPVTDAVLWPVDWAVAIDRRGFVTALAVGSLIVSGLTLLLPDRRLLRMLTAFAIIEMVATINSFGKINHSHHAWLFAACFFALLPAGRWDSHSTIRSFRQQFIDVFWYAQAFILFTYSLSGFWKLMVGTYQLFFRDATTLQPDGLAILVSNHLLKTGGDSLLGGWVIEHTAIGWPAFLGAIYLELFSFIVAFRHRLHRVWGLLLIAFHAANNLVLSIDFNTNILVVGLLIALSPFDRGPLNPAAIAASFPGVDLVLAAFRAVRDRSARPLRLLVSGTKVLSPPAR